MTPVGKYWIEFGGVRNDAVGLEPLSTLKRSRPAVKGKSFQIAGRDGDIWCPDGSMEPVPVKIDLAMTGTPTDIPTVNAWLRGTRLLRDSAMPSRAQKARVEKAIVYQSMTPRMQQQKLTVEFMCQPFYYMYPEAADVVANAVGNAISLQIVNPLNRESAPIIEISATGNFSLTLTNDTNVQDIAFEGVPAGGILLDSELKDALKPDYTLLYNGYMHGDFPLLPCGTTTVQVTADDADAAIASIRISPRWRDE
jgi:phage-related protein